MASPSSTDGFRTAAQSRTADDGRNEAETLREDNGGDGGGGAVMRPARTLDDAVLGSRTQPVLFSGGNHRRAPGIYVVHAESDTSPCVYELRNVEPIAFVYECYTEAHWQHARAKLLASLGADCVLGLDIEYNDQDSTDYDTGDIGTVWQDNMRLARVPLLQVSTQCVSVLVRLCFFARPPASLYALLLQHGLLFVGVNIVEDVKRLRATWGINCRCALDLRHALAHNKRFRQSYTGASSFGLKSLDEFFNGSTLGAAAFHTGRGDTPKAYSDWAVRKLTPEQVEYAANDALAAARIYRQFVLAFATQPTAQQQLDTDTPEYWQHYFERYREFFRKPFRSANERGGRGTGLSPDRLGGECYSSDDSCAQSDARAHCDYSAHPRVHSARTAKALGDEQITAFHLESAVHCGQRRPALLVESQLLHHFDKAASTGAADTDNAGTTGTRITGTFPATDEEGTSYELEFMQSSSTTSPSQPHAHGK